MNITAQVKKYSNELILIASDNEGRKKKKMVFDFEDTPLITVFEYLDEVYDLELSWNGIRFVLWVGTEGAMQEYEVEMV